MQPLANGTCGADVELSLDQKLWTVRGDPSLLVAAPKVVSNRQHPVVLLLPVGAFAELLLLAERETENAR
jgi:hypothetical protein